MIEYDLIREMNDMRERDKQMVEYHWACIEDIIQRTQRDKDD